MTFFYGIKPIHATALHASLVEQAMPLRVGGFTIE